ncbi:hypothetical protein [Alienimonas sp. DA493]|uniref:hypothetical protein n=1 Tax=Alienimonas sp. DA493 TaxID=3373605 RepID=UPI003754E5B8
MTRPLTLLALFGLLAAGPGLTNSASADDDYYDDLEDYYEDLAEEREEYYEDLYDDDRRWRRPIRRGFGYAPPVYRQNYYGAPGYGYRYGNYGSPYNNYGYRGYGYRNYGYPSYGYPSYGRGYGRGFNLNAGPFRLSIR